MQITIFFDRLSSIMSLLNATIVSMAFISAANDMYLFLRSHPANPGAKT